MPSTHVLKIVAAGFLAAGISLQQTPNFTGAWTASEPGPTAPGEEQKASLGSGWGESFTLIQDTNTITVERVLYRPRDFQPTLKFRCALDGTESRDTIMMGRGIEILVSTAAWEGNKLVITTKHPVPEAEGAGTNACVVTRTLSLEPPQQAVGEASLVIETTRCAVLGGMPSTTRVVYTRN